MHAISCQYAGSLVRSYQCPLKAGVNMDTIIQHGIAGYSHRTLLLFNYMFAFSKANLGLGREDCQQAVIDEFLCMVAGCALGTDYAIGCLKESQHGSRSTRFPFK